MYNFLLDCTKPCISLSCIMELEEKGIRMKPVLVVMAAGIGSRYGGLKQMDPVGPGGEWIIEYSIYDAIKAGFERVIFIISRQIEEEFKNVVGSKLNKEIHIDYVIQDIEDVPCDVPKGRKKPWGTAHAIYAARDKINGPFGVINADDFYGRDAYEKLYGYLSKESDDHVLIGYSLRNTLTEHGSVARGVCQLDDDMLINITERTHIEKKGKMVFYQEDGKDHSLNEDATVSMNMWGFQKSILDEIERRLPVFFENELKDNPMRCEFYLPKVVDELIKASEANVHVLKTSAKWFGVTYAADKEKVIWSIDELVQAGVYPRKLWEGDDDR